MRLPTMKLQFCRPNKNARVSANIKHSVDTSIKRQISGQSTPMVNGCMDMFDMVDTEFNF